MDDGSLTATEDESEQSEEEGWVYDVYVREKADEDRKFVGHSGAPTIEASDDAGMEPHIPGITTGDYGVLVYVCLLFFFFYLHQNVSDSEGSSTTAFQTQLMKNGSIMVAGMMEGKARKMA